jgi:hypothetical protein
MSSLPYVLIVLFSLTDGSLATMGTSQGFDSPPSCSMRAFMENESARERVYVCTTREHAVQLLHRGRVETAAAEPASPAR